MASNRVANEDDSVMAWGDNGFEPTPRSETVEIMSIPVGPGNLITPITHRFLHELSGHEGAVPTKLSRVRRCKSDDGFEHVSVEFECTPYVRYTLDSGPVFGHHSCCAAYKTNHAADPMWSRLTPRERGRIRNAIDRLNRPREA